MGRRLSNLERYKKDLNALIDRGNKLYFAMQRECFPDKFDRILKKKAGDKTGSIIESLPSFREEYQSWYSEALALIKQLLPDRLSDFRSHYEKPKQRKNITCENYKIADYLQGLIITRGVHKEKVVGPEHAIPHFEQQLAILESVKASFKSSLFNIRQLVQADLFDSELDAAKELLRNKFARAAGALAGVVLERHLMQVCDNHSIRITKKAPTIADLNNALRDANVIDVPQWRFIQHLADIRNLCAHSKQSEPTVDQVNDLIAGVMKLTKTLF